MLCYLKVLSRPFLNHIWATKSTNTQPKSSKPISSSKFGRPKVCLQVFLMSLELNFIQIVKKQLVCRVTNFQHMKGPDNNKANINLSIIKPLHFFKWIHPWNEEKLEKIVFINFHVIWWFKMIIPEKYVIPFHNHNCA